MKDIAIFGIITLIAFLICNTLIQPITNLNEHSTCLGNKDAILCVGKYERNNNNLSKD